VNPHISITYEDAINLLLTSIAMEEISLSKMLDAETEKILSVLGDCEVHKNDIKGHRISNYSPNEIIAINKSVNDTVKNMIKLQMLLQFKLESVKEMLPSTGSTTTSTSTTTTTSSTTTLSTTSTTITTTLAPISTPYATKKVATVCSEYPSIFSASPLCPRKLKRASPYPRRKNLPYPIMVEE
ncbi:MAG TPA: hypothetical protein VFD02_07115, partial [Syntrophomonadaceae bacterium]|nr:hypothetical protein [Syntrophomonadaceae bacterium]